MRKPTVTPVQSPVASKRKSGAFTLVEMLVVVAVIAILLSILLPTLKGARESGRTAICGSHFHQVGLAAHLYSSNNRRMMPPYAERVADDPGVPILRPLGTGPPESPWGYRRMYLLTTWFKPGPYPSAPRAGDGFFGPYMSTGKDIDNTSIAPDGSIGGLKFIMGCPSVPVGPKPVTVTWLGAPAVTIAHRAMSYGVNIGDSSWDGGMFNGTPDPDYGYDSVGGRRMTTLPSRLLMMADSIGGEPYVLGPAAFPVPEDFTSVTPTPRHVGQFGAIFVDGHTEYGSLEELFVADYWHHYD